MDPTRWSNNDMTEFERQLLDAARSDRVPDALSARMEEVLRVSDVALSGSAAAGKLGASLLVKTSLWGALSLGLVAATAGWYASRSAPAQEPTATAPRLVAQPQFPPVLESPSKVASQPATSAVRHATPDSEAPASPRPAMALEDGDTLRAEVALLARARQALQQRATTRALRLLDRHRGHFANGTLAPEAAALRIEALIQQRSYPLAQAKTEQFVKAYPAHPLRAHVVDLLRAQAGSTRTR